MNFGLIIQRALLGIFNRITYLYLKHYDQQDFYARKKRPPVNRPERRKKSLSLFYRDHSKSPTSSFVTFVRSSVFKVTKWMWLLCASIGLSVRVACIRYGSSVRSKNRLNSSCTAWREDTDKVWRRQERFNELYIYYICTTIELCSNEWTFPGRVRMRPLYTFYTNNRTFIERYFVYYG